MKTANKLLTFLAFCILIITANYTFVAAQVKTDDKSKNKTENEKTIPQTPAKNVVGETNSDLKDSPNPYKNQVSEKFRIGFHDTVSVDVARHPELSQTVNVNSDGTIQMPRINKPIIAVCKTESELKDTITAYYKTYLKEPYVNVKIVEQRSQPVSVIGAVKKPGHFFLKESISLFQLLALAGGQDVEFSGSKIQVAHTGNLYGCADGSEEESKVNVKFVSYNLNDVMRGKDNPLMQPGDIVSVLPAEEAYVVGDVLKPTKISLNEPKTLTQALAAAGGTESTANTGKVIIQRHDPDTGVKKELVFNLKDIKDEKIPDPQLQANDIVQVSTDKFKSVRKGLLDIFTKSIPNTMLRY